MSEEALKLIVDMAYEEGRKTVLVSTVEALQIIAKQAITLGPSAFPIADAFTAFATELVNVESKRLRAKLATVDPAPEQVSP